MMDDLIKALYLSKLFYKVNFKTTYATKNTPQGRGKFGPSGKPYIVSAIEKIHSTQWVKGHSVIQERRDLILRVEAFIEEYLA
jgi:hypothetical protein